LSQAQDDVGAAWKGGWLLYLDALDADPPAVARGLLATVGLSLEELE
jgi:hypothetical protein